MGERTIYITQFDMQRLRRLLLQTNVLQRVDRRNFIDLEKELSRATVVDPSSIPPTVVTMNSTVRFKDLGSKEEMTCTIVFPEDSDADHGKISVIAPIGTALLGYRAGDQVDWIVPAGRRRLKILEVIYQPEAAGHYHL
jgi:regulator of nucleoside diphosphate kinase